MADDLRDYFSDEAVTPENYSIFDGSFRIESRRSGNYRITFAIIRPHKWSETFMPPDITKLSIMAVKYKTNAALVLEFHPNTYGGYTFTDSGASPSGQLTVWPQTRRQDMVPDGEWHLLTIDLSSLKEKTTARNYLGMLRYDLVYRHEAGGTEQTDIDYIGFFATVEDAIAYEEAQTRHTAVIDACVVAEQAKKNTDDTSVNARTTNDMGNGTVSRTFITVAAVLLIVTLGSVVAAVILIRRIRENKQLH